MARMGLVSRRKAESLIKEGRVCCNGSPVKLGDRALAGLDSISIDGVQIDTSAPVRYYILNKPEGVISTTDDPERRTTVVDLIHDTELENVRLFPVGRLDMDSRGLILITNDGFLANRLMHPSFEVQREYMVEVQPVPTPGDLAALRRGVELEDGKTAPAVVSIKSRRGNTAIVKLVIHTGRKRQIRRSFKALGYDVKSLMRIRIGPLGLGKLAEGESRRLFDSEVSALYKATGWE
ncbi:MAG: rRNA pseudouridine synthase [Actinobacteria bacterium]|nr:rRNA pseudouridine synthase [Actinomycetota bacterium]